MLGKQKINRAIPYLIKLLDCIAIIPKKWEGTVLEDQKYFVSQSAIAALGKFKDFAYNGYIEKFLYPEQLGWIDFKESKDRKQLLKSTYLEYKKIAQKAMMK